MKTTTKESKKKEAIRIRKRIDELNSLIFNMPPVPLKKKMFVGHWRFFKVRDDILRSSIGEVVKKVVDACNTMVLGKKNEPKSYEHSYGTVYYKYFGEVAVSHQTLRSLSEDEVSKIGLTPKQIRKYFLISEKTKSFGSKNITFRRYFPAIAPYMIEFAYKPAYIEAVRDVVGDYESELAKLYRKMHEINGWTLLHGNSRDEWDLSLDKKKKLERIRKKEMDDEIEA